MKRKSGIFILIIMFITPLFACNNQKEEGTNNSSRGAAVNFEAPDFSLNNIAGNSFRLSDHSGKVKIIDFWATWCPPCRMEIPDFQSLHEKYSGDNFVMIGISLDDSNDVVKKFIDQYKVTYPILMGNEKVSNAYGGIRGIPTTFVVDKDGKVYKKYIGYTEGRVFEQDIIALLNK